MQGWIPFFCSLKQSLWREFTPFFLKITARVCGGGLFPSYSAQDGPRGERAHLRPTNLIAQHNKINKVHKEWAS